MKKTSFWSDVCLFALVLLLSAEAYAEPQIRLRLGYFPNVTHAQALLGLKRGDFQRALGDSAKLVSTQFNAGPAAVEALFAGEIDVAYIGPNPAINGYVRSKGDALRVVAGATNGGAAFILHPDTVINGPGDLSGKRFASPQLGNTQDVALRAYLEKHGQKPLEKGGTVRIVPSANPQIVDLFRQHEIDGAWVPEPWSSILIIEGKGKLFVDERTLWPDGNFISALIVARRAFLAEHPELVRSILDAHVAVTQWHLAHKSEAAELLNEEIEKLTRKKLRSEVLAQSLAHMTPTWDPYASTLNAAADSAFSLGFLKEKPELGGLYDLGPLNSVLAARNLPAVVVPK